MQLLTLALDPLGHVADTDLFAAKELYRFFALDVETANGTRGSICQIGVAGVRQDNRVDTWSCYVDPEMEHWTCSHIHGITADTVRGAPDFARLLPRLDRLLCDHRVFQHSGFDRSSVNAASLRYDLAPPNWDWQDSLRVARKAWPELKGNGGHGLASLKTFLRLDFQHHDAGEDARAAAQVVLHAEAHRPDSLPT